MRVPSVRPIIAQCAAVTAVFSNTTPGHRAIMVHSCCHFAVCTS